MSVKVTGFDKLQKQLKQMQRAAREISGTHEYSFNELFPAIFMSKYTNHPSIDSFLDNCGYPANTKEEFSAIPDVDFDAYVRRSTRFNSWEDMMGKAAEELVTRKLGI